MPTRIDLKNDKPLGDYTCQELKEDLTNNQKICVRNEMFLTEFDESFLDILDITNREFSTYNASNPQAQWISGADRFVVIARNQGAQLRVFTDDWEFERIIGLVNQTPETDMVEAGGYLFVSKAATSIAALQRFDLPNLDNIIEVGVNRIGGMLKIGDLLYCTPNSGNTNKIQIYDIINDAWSSTNSSNIALLAGEHRGLSYDENDIIAHVGTNNSSVSFYSISGDENLATVNIRGVYIDSHFYDNKWFIFSREGVTVIDANTYNILNEKVTPNWVSKTVKFNQWVLSNNINATGTIVYNLDTFKTFTLDYSGYPVVNKDGDLVMYVVNDTTNYTEERYVIENIQQILEGGL